MCRALARALAVVGSIRDDESARAHVHGFHSYAARMHPETAAALVGDLSLPGQAILDPFCGSGTVVVEARRLGRAGIGSDANPLAVELSRFKVRATSESERAQLVEAAAGVAEHAEDRRRGKKGATRRYGREDERLFDPHVLLELDGLRQGIELAPPASHDALRMVLSAILVKVSRKAGDTSDRETPRRLASGFTIRLFAAKARELAERLDALDRQIPPSAPAARIIASDARRLKGVGASSIDLVVTSPPYPGVYDYGAQHQLRLRWLGLDAVRFGRAEIGARRRYTDLSHQAARDLWGRELGDVFASMRRVLRPEGRLAIVIGDAALQDRPLLADESVTEIATRSGFRWVATASQSRPHVHAPTRRAFGGEPRREHVLVFQKPPRDRTRRHDRPRSRRRARS